MIFLVLKCPSRRASLRAPTQNSWWTGPSKGTACVASAFDAGASGINAPCAASIRFGRMLSYCHDVLLLYI